MEILDYHTGVRELPLRAAIAKRTHREVGGAEGVAVALAAKAPKSVEKHNEPDKCLLRVRNQNKKKRKEIKKGNERKGKEKKRKEKKKRERKRKEKKRADRLV